MEVKLPKKQDDAPKDDAQNELPGDDAQDEGADDGVSLDEIADEGDEGAGNSYSKRERELELKNAKLEGQLELFNQNRGSQAANASVQEQQYMNQVYADLSLADEDFVEKYKGYNKSQVIQAINQQQNFKQTSEVSKLTAKNSLSRKYPDFIEFEDKVDEALADANPQVLADPARLKAFMERQYLAISKDGKRDALPKPKAGTGKKDEGRKTIVGNSDFVPPSPKSGNSKKDGDGGADEIKAEDRELASRFGIKSEAQRKKFMSPYIPMDLGGGYKFESPEKGFEKKAS
jgi:hypothetical protein